MFELINQSVTQFDDFKFTQSSESSKERRKSTRKRHSENELVESSYFEFRSLSLTSSNNDQNEKSINQENTLQTAFQSLIKKIDLGEYQLSDLIVKIPIDWAIIMDQNSLSDSFEEEITSAVLKQNKPVCKFEFFNEESF